MKFFYIVLFSLFGLFAHSQTKITCYNCEIVKHVECSGCSIKSSMFSGVVITSNRFKDIVLYKPVIVTTNRSLVTFKDAFGTEKTLALSDISNIDNLKELYNFLGECFCSESNDNQNITEFSVDNNNLKISIENGNTKIVNLGSISGANQTLDLNNTNLSISNGNTVDLGVMLLDNDPTNEIELPLLGNNGDVLTIENGALKYKPPNIDIKGEFKNDFDAATNGVQINEYYISKLGNTMGCGNAIIKRKY